MKLHILTGTLAAAIVTSSAAALMPQVLYVDDDAPLAGTGLSWESPHRFLQDALLHAATVATVEAIHVGEGIYRPDLSEGGGILLGDRTATFQLLNDLELLGGYAGYGAFNPDERDVTLYPTVLSGDLAENDGENFINYDENSYHVVTGSGAEPSAVLDGFTVTAGYADGPGWPALGEAGAGMLNVAGSPTVRMCRFEANWAAAYGGGMENLDNAGPLIESCAFIGNFVSPGDGESATGGGMDNFDNFERFPTVIDTHFVGNTVEMFGGDLARGGGVYVSGGLITIIDCMFTSNVVMGGDPVTGGGLHVFDCDAVITGSTFDGNWSERAGGGMSISACDPLVESCTFSKNEALRAGGGLYSIDGAPSIISCTFSMNTASLPEEIMGFGGGMFIKGGDAMISDCLFAGNLANNAGGGLYNSNCSPTVKGCIFDCNTQVIDTGGGGGMENNAASPTIVDCDFICNAGAHWAAMGNWNGSNPIVRDCLFMANEATWTGGAIGNSGDDVGSDPLFVSCRFVENFVGGDGSAIWNGFESDARFVNCLFLYNEAVGDGGAVWNGLGGTVHLSSCTVMWSEAGSGGAIYNDDATATIVNSVVWENGLDPISNVSGGTADVRYTDVQFGYPGDGNIAVDPMCWDEMILLPGSPCIGAGDKALLPPDELDLDGDGDTTEPIPFDIDGLGRIAGSAVDMGCYEWHLGDINRDGVVDGQDLGFLLSEWGMCEMCPADLDANGTVEGSDLGLLLGTWG